MVVTALALLAVVAVLFGATVLATRDKPLLSDAPPDSADLALPAGPLGADDVVAARFSMTVRGYRMSEVDSALERLAEALRERDERIAALEDRAGAGMSAQA